MNIGKSLCKLTLGSTFLLGGLAFPPILAGEGIAWGVLLATALASAAAGNTANAIDALVDWKNGDRVSLENENLTEAVGKAIAAVITLAAKNKKYPKKTREHLEKIAAKAKDNWVELARFELSEDPYIKALSKHNYRDLMEEQLPKAVTPTETGLTAETILTAGEWRNIFLKLDLMADAHERFELSSEVKQEVAELLYTTFPKALRETLKEDFANDGKAFAGFTIQLLAGMRAELKQMTGDFAQVLERLQQLEGQLHGNAAEQQAVFSQISQQINSGFAEVCQQLGVLETNITELLQGLEESVKDIREKVADIHARLNCKPLTVEDWREICHQNLALQKQLTTNPFTNADGVTLQRDEIYVPLAILERKAPKALSVGRLEEKKEEELVPIAEESFFEEVLRQGKSHSQGRKIAIIGEAGSGKTTRLQKIADWILEEDLGLPVWVSLADLTQPTVSQYIEDIWLKQTGQNLAIEALTQEKERTWLLLDGLDEMTSRVETRHVSQLLGGWVRDARVVVTCRVNVWEADRNAFSGFDVFRNLEFNSEQVTEYIRRWFAGIGDAAVGESLEKALAESENYRLKELIQNPLRLWMLCQIWQTGGGLPETQAGLYGQFVDWVYRWKADEEILDLREAIDGALGRLALAAMEQQDEDSRFRLRESWVLKVLGSRRIFEAAIKLNWLNRVERFPEAICVFYHATFQEYFAAYAVDDWNFFVPREHIDRPVLDRDNPGQYRRYRIFEPQWKQIILLWLGREDIEKEVKEDFIEFLVKFKNGCSVLEGDSYSDRAYFLAAAGIREFKQCSLGDEIVTNIVNYAFSGTGEYLAPIPDMAKSLLLETDRERLIDILVSRIHTEGDKEKQDKMLQFLLFGAIDGKQQEIIPEFKKQELIPELIKFLDMNYSQSFYNCDFWQNPAFRFLYSWVLQDIRKNLQYLIILTSNTKDNHLSNTLFTIFRGFWERIFYEVITEHQRNFRRELKNIFFQSTEVRERRVLEKNRIVNNCLQTVNYLCEMLYFEDDYIHRIVLWSLLIIIDNMTDSKLLKIQDLFDSNSFKAVIHVLRTSKNSETSLEAHRCLRQIAVGSSEAISVLEEIIDTTSEEIDKLRAAWSLNFINPGNAKCENTIKMLFQTSLNEQMRFQSIYALVLMGNNSPEVVNALNEIIRNSEDEKMCLDAASLLSYIEPTNKSPFDVLINLIKISTNEYLIQQAAIQLRKIQTPDPDAVQVLENLIQSDCHEYTRLDAVYSLLIIAPGNAIATNEAIAFLKTNTNIVTCLNIVKFFGELKITNTEAISAILELLNRYDEDLETYFVVAKSLAQIDVRSEEVYLGIIKILKKVSSVRQKFYTSGFYFCNDAAEICTEFLQKVDLKNINIISSLLELLDARFSPLRSKLESFLVGHPDFINSLIQVLPHDSGKIIKYLGKYGFGNREALVFLVNVLHNNNDDNIRQSAIFSLDHMGAIDTLIDLAENSPNLTIRKKIINDLATTAYISTLRRFEGDINYFLGLNLHSI